MSASRRLVLAAIISILLGSWFPAYAGAQPSQPATGSAAAKVLVRLAVITEEQQKEIQATVTRENKPLRDLTVTFAVERLFGNLTLGHDTTLDDGTAVIAFPGDLPGGPDGKIRVLATVTAPREYAGARVQAVLDGARVVQSEPQAFPRALWAPRAPVLLILTVFVVLGSVWCCYAYVVFQLFVIRRGTK